MAAELPPPSTGAMKMVWTVPSFCAAADQQKCTASSRTGRLHRRTARRAVDTTGRPVFLTINRLLQSRTYLHEFRAIFRTSHPPGRSFCRAGDNQEMPPTKSRTPDVPRNLKPYFLCLLKKGEHWNVTAGHEELMPQYLAYLRKEMESRRIVFAGPITDDGEIIAVAVLEAVNAEEAGAIVGRNPGVKSGHFVAELRPCYLPALDGVQVEY